MLRASSSVLGFETFSTILFGITSDPFGVGNYHKIFTVKTIFGGPCESQVMGFLLSYVLMGRKKIQPHKGSRSIEDN